MRSSTLHSARISIRCVLRHLICKKLMTRKREPWAYHDGFLLLHQVLFWELNFLYAVLCEPRFDRVLTSRYNDAVETK